MAILKGLRGWHKVGLELDVVYRPDVTIMITNIMPLVLLSVRAALPMF